VATQLGREVIVHIPMEARTGNRLGPGGLTTSMSQREVEHAVRASLASVPGARGVSNHMGSLLTPQRRPMSWIMETMRAHGGLYFVDSHTVPESVASRVARESGLIATKRDVFLDHDPRELEIARQFRRLVDLAHERGTALGIGHPYPETLAVLERELRRLDRYAVRLVSLVDLLERQAGGRAPPGRVVASGSAKRPGG
jgi:polysaccharide deacetylase 2 family uncharacterized protein YibQ